MDAWTNSNQEQCQVPGINDDDDDDDGSRQCIPVVRALALRSGGPEVKTCSGYWLNLFQEVPGSTSQLHL